VQSFYSELSPNIYRITVAPSEHFSFNQFLIKDENPILIHTGRALWFEHTRNALEQLLDPAQLKYISFSHFEADESGALNHWLALAPEAIPLVGTIGKASIEDFSTVPCQVLSDGDQINLGALNLTFLETPHCPHNWDACMFYESNNKILFCSDLGAQPGIPNGFIETSDIIETIVDFQKKVGYLTTGQYLLKTLDRIEKLDIEYLAIQHGATLKGPVIQKLIDRLRQEFY